MDSSSLHGSSSPSDASSATQAPQPPAGNCTVQDYCYGHATEAIVVNGTCTCTCSSSFVGARCDECKGGRYVYPRCEKAVFISVSSTATVLSTVLEHSDATKWWDVVTGSSLSRWLNRTLGDRTAVGVVASVSPVRAVLEEDTQSSNSESSGSHAPTDAPAQPRPPTPQQEFTVEFNVSIVAEEIEHAAVKARREMSKAEAWPNLAELPPTAAGASFLAGNLSVTSVTVRTLSENPCGNILCKSTVVKTAAGLPAFPAHHHVSPTSPKSNKGSVVAGVVIGVVVVVALIAGGLFYMRRRTISSRGTGYALTVDEGLATTKPGAVTETGGYNSI